MSNETIATASETETSAQVTPLLVALAYGWTPPAFEIGPIRELTYNGIDFSELVQHLSIDGDRLTVVLGGAGFHNRMREIAPFPFDAQLAGTLANGSVLHGDMVLRAFRGAGLSFEMGEWTIVRGTAPRFWVGEVEGLRKLRFGGNLSVERVPVDDSLRLGRKCHFLLSGGHTYYLIQTLREGAWHLVVETDDGIPNRQLLDRDFLLLQFVLGHELHVRSLTGLSADQEVVAAINGIGAKRSASPRPTPPVPIDRNNDSYVDASWAPVLFEKVIAAWRARPQVESAYLMAFSSYLDSMTLYVDADYLRLQVALEAFAYWLLTFANGGERTVVKDKAAWKKWVKDNGSAIRALASEGFEESLFNKVTNVYRLASGRVVPSAFLDQGLTLSEELASEVELRDVVVHQGAMSSPEAGEHDDLRRVAMVRTLLVALIAKSVDYGGAINGWEIGSAGYPKEPDASWWIVREKDSQRARCSFFAERAAPR